MNDWAVTEFVSRVAERVTSAREDFAAQLAERYSPDDADDVLYTLRLPVVEPSPEFVDELRRRLLAAPVVLPEPVAFINGTRLAYGFAAVGSLASAAVVVVLILRNRAAQRAAA
jgi:hypothetical protein